MTAQDPSGVGRVPALRPTKLGHVAAFTPSLEPMQGFYQDLLGFRWSDTIGDFFVFLRCNADHHAANFLASTKSPACTTSPTRCATSTTCRRCSTTWRSNDYRLHWGPGRHGPGHNLFTYHRDPDGNTIELFTQLDSMIDEANGYFEPRPWHEDVPQVPEDLGGRPGHGQPWGPVDRPSLDH